MIIVRKRKTVANKSLLIFNWKPPILLDADVKANDVPDQRNEVMRAANSPNKFKIFSC